jgi:DNA (cytosine-5)-methyltransferase 1
LLENENLQIIAETDPADLDSGGDGEAAVPVRLLTDFSIYGMNSLELVPIAELLQLQYETGKVYGASGSVKAWSDESDDQEDEPDIVEDDNSVVQPEDQRVKLSSILEVNIHDVSKQRLDRLAVCYFATSKHLTSSDVFSNIYIRTTYAWYILDIPSKSYFRYFERFWIQHRILHLVASTGLSKSPLYNPRVTYSEFMESLNVTPESPDAVAMTVKILGRELTRDDIEADDVVCKPDSFLPSQILNNVANLSEGLRFVNAF